MPLISIVQEQPSPRLQAAPMDASSSSSLSVSLSAFKLLLLPQKFKFKKPRNLKTLNVFGHIRHHHWPPSSAPTHEPPLLPPAPPNLYFRLQTKQPLPVTRKPPTADRKLPLQKLRGRLLATNEALTKL